MASRRSAVPDRCQSESKTLSHLLSRVITKIGTSDPHLLFEGDCLGCPSKAGWFSAAWNSGWLMHSGRTALGMAASLIVARLSGCWGLLGPGHNDHCNGIDARCRVDRFEATLFWKSSGRCTGRVAGKLF